MKKIALIMLAVVSMALVSCGGGKKDKQETPQTAEAIETPVAEPAVEESPVIEEPSVHHFVGKVAGADVHMSMLVDGSTVIGRYYYDSQRKKGNKASMMFFGEKYDESMELTEFYTDHPTGQFNGDWIDGVYKGTFTRAKDGKTFDFELTEVESGEAFFTEEELVFEIPDFEIPDFDMNVDLDFSDLGIDYSDSGSADWDKILNEYEQFVNKYYSYAEKVSKGNASAMTDALSMAEKAQSIAQKLESAQGNLSMAQSNRLLKIQNKLMQATTIMANAASKVEDMMDDYDEDDYDDE